MFLQPIDKKEERNVIVVENVSKRFKIPYNKKRTVFENLKGVIKGERYSYDEFCALKSISFKVKKGETLGIIGENGSGKSTLLKILAGVLKPDSGTVKVNGKLASILELGVGFHPELTAIENVQLYGAIMGITRNKIKEKSEAIFEFAELDRFKDMKLKNFSSGMYARLAFATAIAADPDLFLIDEVLAVGDEAFQRKCIKQIEDFRKVNKTIIFVSHDVESVKKLCNKVLLLKKGEIIENNNSSLVVDKYHAMLSSTERALKPEKPPAKEKKESENEQTCKTSYKRFGTRKAEIFDIQFNSDEYIANNNGMNIIKFGAETCIQLKIRFNEEAINPIVGFIIRDIDGKEICGTNTLWNKISLGKFNKNDAIQVTFSQRIILNNNIYYITVALAHQDAIQFYDWHDNVILFKVDNSKNSSGVVDLQSKIKIIEINNMKNSDWP